VQRGTRREPRPVVLFVDEDGWDCHFQLASGLRRAGFRTIRVTMKPPSRAAALCFNRTVQLGSVSDLASLESILDGENVVDVQAIESLALQTYQGFPATSRPETSANWARRIDTVDKLVVSRRLQTGGFFAPDVVPAPVAGAREVVEALGLPVVHKPRVASGGMGLSIICTLEDLERALSEGGNSDSYFFERHVDGRSLQIGGVVDGGGMGPVATCETVGRPAGRGPASQLLGLDDPELAETGRKLATHLGIEGMINVEVIRDADGRDWVHDVNPRVWGSFAAFRVVGVDFLGAYVDWLRGIPEANSRRGIQEETRIDVLPGLFLRRQPSESRVEVQARLTRAALPYLKWVGPRHVAYELAHNLKHR